MNCFFRAGDLSPNTRSAKPGFPFERYLAGHFFKQSFYSGFFDPLKRKLFFLPVRWHSKPLNEKWNAVEQAAMRELLLWVTPADQNSSAATAPHCALEAKSKVSSLSALRITAYVWIFRRRIAQYFGRAIRGDRETIARIGWFARTFMFGMKSARLRRPENDTGRISGARFGITHKNEKRSESPGVPDIPGHKTSALHSLAKFIEKISDAFDLEIFIHIDKSAVLPHELLQEVETGFIG